MRPILCALSVALSLVTIPSHGAAPDPVFAEHGIVVSASSHASAAGVAILRQGGNAVDAAVATGFALAVTYPAAGNIGGGGFMVAHLADGTQFTLDFREMAPELAERNMFLDEDGNVDSNKSLRSPLASGVPGSVDGLLKAWRDHGSGAISREALMASAITLARDGFPLSRQLAASFNGTKNRFAKDPGATKVFIRDDGREWEAGDLFRLPDLATTLERIAVLGRAGFYFGKTAKRFAKQMKATGGLITERDLAAYFSIYREPIRGQFLDYEIVSMPPPSSGGILLVQMLNMLELLNVQSLPWNGADYVHLLTEVQRRAYADRAEHLGDSDYWPVPGEWLTSTAYAKERIATIDRNRATNSEDVFAGGHIAVESEETTHYSVADAAGNAVAVTTTLNGGYGSGIVVDGSGFLLNNEMDDFSSKPGEPNMYGLVGNEANAIEGGKRMLSSMTPTIVLRDSKPYLIVGSPGGSTIITTALQVVLNATVHHMDIQQAVSAPRHHSQWLPDQIAYEPFGLSPDTLAILRNRGHALRQRGSIGHANCIMITGDGLFAAPDPRGENAAAGY